jgi:hypothetical protein
MIVPTPSSFSSLRPRLWLAGHAQTGPGNGLQPFFGDWLPAVGTDTICPIIDACQCLLYFGEQRFLIVQNHDPRLFPGDPPPLLPALQRHRWPGFHLRGRRTSSQCRDMPLNISLFLFKSLSHDGQVNCHLFVSFHRTVHTREYYTSFSLSAVIS